MNMTVDAAHTNTAERNIRRTVGKMAAAASAGLAAALVLVSCGTGDGGAENSGTSEAGDGIIEFEYGGYSAAIPENPERVVALDSRTALEFSVLADYPLVATVYPEESHLTQYVGDDVIHFRDSAFDLNREEVASYDPDLIVVGAGWWAYYEENGMDVSDVAPVLVVAEPTDAAVEEGFIPEFTEMSEQLELIGRAEKVEESVGKFNDTLDEARAELADIAPGTTVGVVWAGPDNFQVLTDSVYFRPVLEQLGFTVPDNETIDNAEVSESSGFPEFSYEHAMAALSDADLLIVQNADSLEGNATWERLPAIAEGHWAELDHANRFGFALTYTDFIKDVVEAAQTLKS